MDLRISRLKQWLPAQGCDYLIVDSPENLFYLLGIQLSAGKLIVGADLVELYVDGRYYHACKEALPITITLTKGFGKESAFSENFSRLQGKIAFDSFHTSYQSYLELEEIKHNKAKLIAVLQPIEQLRVIKDSNEIDAIEEACRLATEGFDYLLTQILEGISEEQLAAKLEIYWKSHGGEKPAFETIIAFGENSAKPHHRAGLRELRYGDIILVDCGVMKNHYASDLTRVLSFGEPNAEISQIYKIVYEAQQKAFSACHPGVLTSALDAIAREFIRQQGYGDFFPHSLGHGLGLNVHEIPRIKEKDKQTILLQEGMVFTIEPGIYIPGLGGVRLENTVVLQQGRCRTLTNAFLPKEILNVYKPI